MTYDVTLDPESLEGQEVAFGNEGDEGVRYSVGLKGTVDDHWRTAFKFVQLNATGFYRYRLDEKSPKISFQARGSDRMSDVSAVVSRLGSFLALVNRTASSGDFE